MKLHQLLFALLLPLAPVAGVKATTNYTFTDLGTLGGSYSYGFGINSSGQVTGSSAITGSSPEHAFVTSGGVMTDLGTLGGTSSGGYAINNSGQVTGYADTSGYSAADPIADGHTHAFVTTGGVMTDLGTLGGSSSLGFGINSSGQVTGSSDTTRDRAQHAFVTTGSVMADLGTLGGTDSVGFGINSSGQVTGWSDTTGNSASHAFLYSGGIMSNLGTLGGKNSEGFGINSSGQVTGYSNTASGADHAFVSFSGVMIDLGTLGGTYSYGSGINSSGYVVGNASILGGTVDHAFLYDGTSMIDLNAVTTGLNGFSLESAQAINDQGAIVGFGQTSGGQTHAFLLTAQNSGTSGNAHTATISSVTTLDAGSTSRTIDGISFVSENDWIIGQNTSSNSLNLLSGNVANVTASGKGVYVGENAGSNNNTLTIAGTLSANQVNVGATGNTGNKLVVDGVVSSGVIVASGSTLSGHGFVDTITGAGTVAPGNSPGILTATSVNPSGGLTFDFQFTQSGAPTFGNARASGNDVLHLTGLAAFDNAMTAANSIVLDFTGTSPQLGQVYDGGFYSDLGDIFDSVKNAQLSEIGLDVGLTVTMSTVQENADFVTGSVNGWVTRFTIISAISSAPEPSRALLLCGGFFATFLRRRRLRE